jgi:hypothetical protein
MMAAMKALTLLSLIVVAACSGPSKQDAAKVFAAATTSMATAQQHAVSAAQTTAVRAPAQLGLNYSGPCALGGTAAVTGSYDATGTGMDAAFDLQTTFSGCSDGVGSLDGNLHWTSTANGTSFAASMTGSLSYADANTNASCDFDLHLAVTGQSVTYTGSACGYDVKADLGL